MVLEVRERMLGPEHPGMLQHINVRGRSACEQPPQPPPPLARPLPSLRPPPQLGKASLPPPVRYAPLPIRQGLLPPPRLGIPPSQLGKASLPPPVKYAPPK